MLARHGHQSRVSAMAALPGRHISSNQGFDVLPHRLTDLQHRPQVISAGTGDATGLMRDPSDLIQVPTECDPSSAIERLRAPRLSRGAGANTRRWARTSAAT